MTLSTIRSDCAQFDQRRVDLALDLSVVARRTFVVGMETLFFLVSGFQRECEHRRAAKVAELATKGVVVGGPVTGPPNGWYSEALWPTS
jgi:hypothetical protein